jgi:hypothetical protein
MTSLVFHSAVCIFDQQSSDVTVNSENEKCLLLVGLILSLTGGMIAPWKISRRIFVKRQVKPSVMFSAYTFASKML